MIKAMSIPVWQYSIAEVAAFAFPANGVGN